MKIVYIAGPYTGGDYKAIEANIRHAESAAASMASEGIGYFCPHLNSAHFEELTPDVPPEHWYEMDLEILRRCDAIYMLEGWTDSMGSRAELDEAIRLGLPVFYEGEIGSELDEGEWGSLLEWAKGVKA